MGIDTNKFVHPPPDYFICGICCDVFDQCYKTKCNHRYCIKCLELCLCTEESLCVYDRKPITRSQCQPDNSVDQFVGTLLVYCDFKEKCDWVGPYADLRKHLMECKYKNTVLQKKSSEKEEEEKYMKNIEKHLAEAQKTNVVIIAMNDHINELKNELESYKVLIDYQNEVIAEKDKEISELKKQIDSFVHEIAKLKQTEDEIKLNMEAIKPNPLYSARKARPNTYLDDIPKMKSQPNDEIVHKSQIHKSQKFKEDFEK